jgi:signal transduction histidine kinase
VGGLDGLVEELRTCFLFEKLTDSQLQWLAEHGTVASYDEGVDVYVEGQPAEWFYVLLDGKVQLIKRVSDDDVVINTTDMRGVYAGATRSFISVSGDQSYANTFRTVVASRLFQLRAEDFAYVLQTWFPMAVHLLDGMFLGLTNAGAMVGEREKLIALGSLSAGLAHELNNPAAASVRAAEALNGQLTQARKAMKGLAVALTSELISSLVALLAEAIEQARQAPALSTMEAGDREDELAARLSDAGVSDAWELAPTLATSGVDDDWVDRTLAVAGPMAGPAVRWMAASLEIDSLVREIRGAAGRISDLVAAMKDYSHLDGGPMEDVDIHDGLESTLVILGHKLKKGIEVVRDYDRDLPRVRAYGNELSQVWTNLIHNASDAMGGKGRLSIRTWRDRDCAVVEIGDTGVGIPPELQRRIFEPFFTTKDVGQGTGLGLDISYRIIVRRHHGDITVQSEPGDTRFVVKLPLPSTADL